jgi:hypothetical protein
MEAAKSSRRWKNVEGVGCCTVTEMYKMYKMLQMVKKVSFNLYDIAMQNYLPYPPGKYLEAVL